MNHDDLTTFLALVKAGSVLGASRGLGLSRATVRRRLEALEKALDCPLMEREGEALALTPAGQLLLREGPALLGAAKRLEAALKQVSADVSGTLTVAMLSGLPGPLFTSFARELAARWPALHVVGLFTPDPLAELSREADVAICSGERPNEPWVARQLSAVEERAFAHRVYLERAGRPQALSDLAAHRLLAWATPDRSASHWPLRRGGAFEARAALTTNDLRTLYDCVGEGLGIALLPIWFAAADWEQVLPSVLGRRRPFWLATGAASRWSPLVRAFGRSLTTFLAAELSRLEREASARLTGSAPPRRH